ncbi:hypothetical protein GCM10028868_25350 [Virgibacillus kimchii]
MGTIFLLAKTSNRKTVPVAYIVVIFGIEGSDPMVGFSCIMVSYLLGGETFVG